MKSRIQGLGGIITQTDNDGNVMIYLDHDTEEVLKFARGFCDGNQMLNGVTGESGGYNLAVELKNMSDYIGHLQTEIDELKSDSYYKENNPAVKNAWEQYQIMLALAKQDDREHAV